MKRIWSIVLALVMVLTLMPMGAFTLTASAATENMIAAGETLTVEIVGGEVSYIKFVPTVSGTYTFSSNSSSDTYGYLYDANKNQITYDDDDGDGNNFSITYDLTAGVNYYWGARYYNTSASGSFDVTLVCDEIFCEHNTTTEHAGLAATCTTDGYTAGTFCEDCDEWITGHEFIRKHHTDENDDEICDICGEDATMIISDGTCGDNLTWALYDNDTLVISGEGQMWNYSSWSECAPWKDLLFSNVIIEDSVTSIGDYAFNGCSSLTSVTIPDSVTSIGNYAFRDCTRLTSVTIPDSVTSIGDDAFYYCTSLTSVTIPDSVTSIADYAFAYCTRLTSITIPDSVTSIGDRAFYNCTSLISVTIPDSVTSIGNSAFYYCTSLTSVTIPDSVTSIGSYAFDNCTSLTSVTIGDSVTSIGYWMFYNCRSLTSVTIPDGVTSIGDYAFYDCTSLTSITIPDSVTSIGDRAFSGCYRLTDISIPNGVTSISRGTFAECLSLVNVALSNTVSELVYCAFASCYSLTEMTLPDSVISIDDYVFADCSYLTAITIPESVESIGYGVFKNCNDVTIHGYSGSFAETYAAAKNIPFIAINSCQHTYDNACDAECNECGDVRVIEHTYAGDCDGECDVCGELRDVSAEHTYGDGQDAECSVCGTLRMPTSISVTTKPDKLSYLVGESFIDAGMVITVDYDNGTSSMVTSGYTVSGFDSATAGTKTVTVSYAGFTASFDVTVNEPVIDENAPAFVVNGPNRPVRAGDTFTVTVNTKNNPGIVSLKVDVGYDANVLELLSIEEQDFVGTTFGSLTNNPIAVNWIDTLNPNNTTDGVAAVLTFKVREDAALGDTAITLSYDPDNVYDYDFNNVTFAKVNGAVSVVEYISGDVNGDGVVNNKDLGVLQRYINGWDVDINVSAGDVNGDGSVNNKDLGVLQRYINGWNVELK